MDPNLLSIIKKEKEKLEDKNDNYLLLSCDVHVKVENGFDDCLQNSVLSNNQQETFYYDDFKEEKPSCSMCSENFNNRYSLYKHNLMHLKVTLLKRPLFICGICSNFYKTKKQLQNHITTAHEDKTLYNRTNSLKASLRKCDLCKKVLEYKTWFDHKKNCHKQTQGQCDKCNKLFKCPRYLKKHILHVHEGRPWKKRVHQEGMTVPCPKCPKILNSKSSLTTHLKNCHSEGMFQCKICKSMKKSKSYLLSHMRTVHDDDGILHHCDICGKSFKSLRRVRLHKKYSHTSLTSICQEGMTVQCPKCPKILNRKYSLKKHIMSCHTEETFQCKICKSVLKSKHNLATHINRVHYDDGMLHSCDICGKSFKSPSKVKKHKFFSHTDRKVIPSNVQCPKCPKILNCKSSLTAHLKNCHSEKTLQCEICKSMLKSKTSLLTHMNRLHYGHKMLGHYGIYRLYF